MWLSLIVDWYYFDALAHESRGVFASEEPFTGFAELRGAQRASDKKLIAIVEGMRDADLEAETRLERRDHMQVERAGDVLLHLFQHQIHHRGQVHAMLAART